MSIEVKYTLQIISLIVVVLFFILFIISMRIISKVKALPQESGLEYEKERAKLEGKSLINPRIQIVIYAIIAIYLFFSLIMRNTVKSFLGGDTPYTIISFIITFIVVLPLGIRSYKNIKAWNNFKRGEKE